MIRVKEVSGDTEYKTVICPFCGNRIEITKEMGMNVWDSKPHNKPIAGNSIQDCPGIVRQSLSFFKEEETL